MWCTTLVALSPGLLLLLLLLLLPPPPTQAVAATTAVTMGANSIAASTCGSNASWVNGVAIGNGENLRVVYDVTDAGRCCGECAAEPKCGAWTFADREPSTTHHQTPKTPHSGSTGGHYYRPPSTTPLLTLHTHPPTQHAHTTRTHNTHTTHNTQHIHSHPPPPTTT